MVLADKTAEAETAAHRENEVRQVLAHREDELLRTQKELSRLREWEHQATIAQQQKAAAREQEKQVAVSA